MTLFMLATVTKDTNADDKAELALKSSNPTIMNDECWIDSGASQHMTPERKSLMNYTRFEQPKLSDDGVLHPYGRGDVSLTVYNDRECKHLIKGRFVCA